MLAVGSGGQSVDWIARNAIGWMTYHRDPDVQRSRHSMWLAAVNRLRTPALRAFGAAMQLELTAHAETPATALPLGYSTGRHAASALATGQARGRYATRQSEPQLRTPGA